MTVDIDLPSGAKLKVTMAPFADAKALYQAMMEEAAAIKIDTAGQIADLMKNIFCIGFSSKKIEKALEKCLARATYNDLKIDKDTFEPAESREDYISVCYEVARVNINPFMKNLSAKYFHLLDQISGVQGSKS